MQLDVAAFPAAVAASSICLDSLSRTVVKARTGQPWPRRSPLRGSERRLERDLISRKKSAVIMGETSSFCDSSWYHPAGFSSIQNSLLIDRYCWSHLFH